MLKAALGDSYKIETMRAGVLRLGGVPTSYGEHVLVTGDAAGMIDPMTGEGIHHAMDGGKMAGQTLLECIKQGNYSAEAMKVYQQRWMYAFGSDFTWSDNICQVRTTHTHRLNDELAPSDRALPHSPQAATRRRSIRIWWPNLACCPHSFCCCLVPVPLPDLPRCGRIGRPT
jgi:hypothetical protein